jgi:nicotinate-nucleotide adenylyltransferase
MKIGIYGGTFDPPHIAHMILADEARDRLGLAKVLWVLTPQSPFKEHVELAPLEDRLAMLEAALAGDPRFQLSRAEIDRPAPQYTVDTVRALREEHPGHRLYYLMGGDSLHDLPTWHNPIGIIANCDGIGVMRRPGDRINLDELESNLPGLAGKLVFIDAPLIQISGTEIRSRIAAGEAFRYFLRPEVFRIIVERRLYGFDGTSE